MAVKVLEDISLFTTFAQQMIPHHQNAVAMSKILGKHMTAHDFPTWEEEGADGPDEAEYGYQFAEYLNQEIIAVQNYQIQQLQGWLKQGVKDWPDLIGNPHDAHGHSGYCYDHYPLNPKCHGIGEDCPKDRVPLPRGHRHDGVPPQASLRDGSHQRRLLLHVRAAYGLNHRRIEASSSSRMHRKGRAAPIMHANAEARAPRDIDDKKILRGARAAEMRRCRL